jgi:hypothetical protein
MKRFHFKIRPDKWHVLFLVFVMTACSKEGVFEIPVPYEFEAATPTVAVLQTFDAKYPGARDIVWSRQWEYFVADFTTRAVPVNAWFEGSGDWQLSKRDISFRQLPDSVSNAFQTSNYTGWNIDKVRTLERKGMKDVYLLELDNGTKATNIYYSEYGDLVKIQDDARYSIDRPVQIPDALTEAVNTLYADYELIDIWSDPLGIRVCIMEANLYKVVALDARYNWINTVWNVEKKDVPDSVQNRFARSQYGPCPIEELKVMKDPDGIIYLFYFNDDNKTKMAMIKESGNTFIVVSSS